MIKAGLIGIGGMGNVHSDCYRMLAKNGVVVSAAADADQEKLDRAVKLHRCRGYRTGEELLEAEDLDLVDICLPTWLHAGLALKAMEKKRAVLIEKPVCRTQAELNRLLKKQKETGANVAVSQCLRFWDEYEWLKTAVDKKIYGRALSAVLTRLAAAPPRSSWFQDPEKSGSAALDLHIHDVDMLRYLFGEPGAVSSTGIRDRKGVLQHIITIYTFGSVTALAEGGWNYSEKFPFSMGYRINFEKGDAVFDSRRKPALIVYPKDREPFVPEFKRVGPKDGHDINVSSKGAYYKELEYFTGCLLKGKAFGRSVLADIAPSMELAFREIRLAGGLVKR
jgi:predicted dehydrogenase